MKKNLRAKTSECENISCWFVEHGLTTYSKDNGQCHCEWFFSVSCDKHTCDRTLCFKNEIEIIYKLSTYPSQPLVFRNIIWIINCNF